jgi:hypothetical protein
VVRDWMSAVVRAAMAVVLSAAIWAVVRAEMVDM